MTGGGRGFCVVKIPQSPDEPAAALIGRVGVPIGAPYPLRVELARLRSQVGHIEEMLVAIHCRIEMLEAGSRSAALGV